MALLKWMDLNHPFYHNLNHWIYVLPFLAWNVLHSIMWKVGIIKGLTSTIKSGLQLKLVSLMSTFDHLVTTLLICLFMCWWVRLSIVHNVNYFNIIASPCPIFTSICKNCFVFGLKHIMVSQFRQIIIPFQSLFIM
jgi:hypothetical protein